VGPRHYTVCPAHAATARTLPAIRHDASRGGCIAQLPGARMARAGQGVTCKSAPLKPWVSAASCMSGESAVRAQNASASGSSRTSTSRMEARCCASGSGTSNVCGSRRRIASSTSYGRFVAASTCPTTKGSPSVERPERQLWQWGAHRLGGWTRPRAPVNRRVSRTESPPKRSAGECRG
jgi:hypothetical protein